MPQDRFEFGSDKTITASAVTKDGAASTGTGTCTYTLTGARGTSLTGPLLASGSCPWDAAKAAYVGYIAATTWAAQVEATTGELVVVITEGGTPKTICRDASFCKGK